MPPEFLGYHMFNKVEGTKGCNEGQVSAFIEDDIFDIEKPGESLKM
jgi:hypothetical protein